MKDFTGMEERHLLHTPKARWGSLVKKLRGLADKIVTDKKKISLSKEEGRKEEEHRYRGFERPRGAQKQTNESWGTVNENSFNAYSMEPWSMPCKEKSTGKVEKEEG